MTGEPGKDRLRRRRVVQATAERMRDLVFACEPDVQIGTLPDIAQRLGVGIVTVQQAARILEHEGLLAVRRGPGGGYYGARPDEAALERALGAYMRAHGSAYLEAMDMMSLLSCELVSAATACADLQLHQALQALIPRIDLSDTEDLRVAFERDLQQVLFKMVDRPFVELLTRVTMHLYKSRPMPAVFEGEQGVAAWKAGRRRLIQAVLQQDEALARFEATRNRNHLLLTLRRAQGAPG